MGLFSLDSSGSTTPTIQRSNVGVVDYVKGRISLNPINIKVGIFRKRKGQLSENLENYYFEIGIKYKKKKINFLRFIYSFFYLLTKSKL